MLAGFETKDAWALCTFAYSAGPGTEPILFEGRTDGRIVPARGTANFGWDAVFEAGDTGKTYGSHISLPGKESIHSHIQLRGDDPGTEERALA
jgi:inosine/xanthosine triphosphate pyrophosphatase family protein